MHFFFGLRVFGVFTYPAVYKHREDPIYTVNMLLAHATQHGSTDLLALKMF